MPGLSTEGSAKFVEFRIAIRKEREMIRISLSVLLGLALLTVAGAGDVAHAQARESNLSGSVRVIGSNTVTPVSTAWAEAFMKLHPNVSVSISGPGSGPGIAAIIDNTTDIGQSSRSIRPQEIERAKANGNNPVETIVAWDGLAMIVNKKNPVNHLTMEQIAGIYLGTITNWKEVGGKDSRIVLVSRDTASGTHAFFKEFVLNDAEFHRNTMFQPSTSTGVIEVTRNERAIFYAGLGYVTDDVKVIGVKQDGDSPAVLPSIATVNDKSYPLARPLFYYTVGEPTGLARAFIDFGLTPAGAELVQKLGFVPLP